MGETRGPVRTTEGTVTVRDEEVVIRQSPWAVFRRNAVSDLPGLASHHGDRVGTAVALAVALLTVGLAGYSVMEGHLGFALGSVVPILVLYLAPWFRNTRIPRSAVEDVRLDPDSRELTLTYRSVDHTEVTTFGPSEVETTLRLRSVDDVHEARANFRGMGVTEAEKPAEQSVDGTEPDSGDRDVERSD
jgi:hypothetical protein